MLNIPVLLICWLTPGAFADALPGQMAVRPRAVTLAPAELNTWLNQNPARWSEWFDLPPGEFAHALGHFGATEAFKAQFKKHLAAQHSEFEKQKLMYTTLRSAFVDQTFAGETLLTEDLHALYRFLLAVHGLPQREFPTRAAALAYLDQSPLSAPARAQLERNLVEVHGKFHLILSYSAWSLLPKLTSAQSTVPSWDASTKAVREIEIEIDSREAPSTLAKRIAGEAGAETLEREISAQLATHRDRRVTLPLDAISGAARVTMSGAVEALAPGEPLHLGDVLIYTDKYGVELRRAVALDDSLIAVGAGDSAEVLNRREMEERQFAARSYRLTALRRRDHAGSVLKKSNAAFYEEHVAPSAVRRCWRMLVGS